MWSVLAFNWLLFMFHQWGRAVVSNNNKMSTCAHVLLFFIIKKRIVYLLDEIAFA
jgi:hypothetical protein